MYHISKRIFFWILVVLFFATAPLIILYSLGYRFNFQRGIFIYTGSVSIKSNPQEVQILIDNKEQSKSFSQINYSYNIGGIKPGELLIEVKAPGFCTWTKKITVNSGTSTEFWNVVLAKEDYDLTSYRADDAIKFFFDPGKKLIAFTKARGEDFSVGILDVSDEDFEAEAVFSSTEYSFTSDEKENIEWSPRSKKIIIPSISGEIKNYFIVDTKTKVVLDLRAITGKENLEKVRWDQEDKNFIYFLSDGELFHLDTDDTKNLKVIAKNVASYDLSTGKIYYFQIPSGIIYRIDSDGSGQPEQITTASPDNIGNGKYQITVYDEDRIAILNKLGDLYIHNKGNKGSYFRKLGSNIKDVQFSDDGKKMIYYTDYDIYAYFTRDWEVQPWRNEDEQKEIARFSEKIDNVGWTRDYEHVIFKLGDKIKFAEIDKRGQTNMADILEINAEKTQIVNDFWDGKIYFIDNINGKNNLFSIDFPEDERILGF